MTSEYDDTEINEPVPVEVDGLPTAPVEVGGQFTLLMPGPPDRVGFRAVATADVPSLMAAYRTACRLARETEALLTDAGMADELLSVFALVDDTGRPAIQVLLTVHGARRFAHLLSSGSRPPPRQSAA